MNRRRNGSHKYNRIYQTIKEYHLNKLELERNPNSKYTEETKSGYSREYSSLIVAKKRIKDRIKEYVDAALIFPEIIMMGKLPKKQWIRIRDFQHLTNDEKLSDYDFSHDEGNVKEEISNEAKEFVTDIFNEDVVSRLLKVMFNHGYDNINKKSDINKEYKINVAKKMATAAINELIRNLEPGYSNILSQDLRRAVEICNAIRAKPPTKGQAIISAIKKASTK